MGIDEIITLENGKQYVLLQKTTYENVNYYLASVAVDEKVTDDYLVFKEYNENGEYSVEEVTESNLVKNLLVKFENELK